MGRVALVASEPQGTKRDVKDWPVIVGVAAPKGALADPSLARVLDAAGREVRHRWRPLTAGMRTVETRPPWFPEVKADTPITPDPGKHWQVLCGDAGHWRVGLYSPKLASAAECTELEQHDCPEFFLLISGRLTLVLAREGRLDDLAGSQPGTPPLSWLGSCRLKACGTAD